MQEDASRCLEFAKRKKPVNSPDCVVKMALLPDDAAFTVAKRWLTQYPDDVHVRTFYLHRLREGTDEQVRQAVTETRQWLSGDSACPGHVHVRVAYLALVNERMPGELVEALNETADWLNGHTEYPGVIEKHLWLIKKKGTPDQVKQALDYTSKWLAAPENQDHPGYAHVGTAYLKLLADKKKGDKELLRRTLDEIANWLSQHDEDVYLRASYFATVREGTTTQYQRAIDEGLQWITDRKHQEHPGYGYIGAPYLKLLADKKKGDKELLRRTLDEIANWLSQHDEDVFLRAGYYATVREGTTAQYQRAIDEGIQWISDPKHPASALVISAYFGLIKHKGTEPQVEQIIAWARSWLDKYPENPGYGTLRVSFNELIRVRKPKEFKHILKDTLFWANGHKNHPGYRHVMNYCDKY